MNLFAIFSKTGKGVQEASGKTSHLSRADRNVLKEIDGKTALADVARKFEKLSEEKFDQLIQQLDKDGFIREVSSGAAQPAAPVGRFTAPLPRTPPPASRAAPPPADDGGEVLDFTQAIKLPPKGPAVDLAAASHAEAERKAKEGAFDYKARQEAEAKVKADADAKARAAAAEAKARAAAEEKAREAADAKSRDESEAKVKAARDAAMRLASEAKAKTEAAEQRARKEAEERARLEAEMKARLEEERKAREAAERRAAEAAEQARKELEEKARREAEEMRQRLEAEMQAKLEEERRKREEEEKKRRQEEEQRRAKEDAERRAREEADRKRREDEDRKRREEDERRRKDDEQRRAREEEERKRRAKEDEERRARDEQDRKRREEDERKRREEDDRRRREETERRAKEEAEAKASAAEAAARSSSQPATSATAPPAAADPLAGLGDSLLADLDSFSQRDEEERKAKEEAERKEKEAAARRVREDEERRKREEEDRRRREEEEREAKAKAKAKAKAEAEAEAEAERRASEEEERREREEEEERRQTKEAAAAKEEAEEKAAKSAAAARSAAKGDDDVGVMDEDLDMDDVKRDEKALSKEARRREAERMEPVVAAKVRRPVNWGKPAAVALFVILVGGVGALNVMPVSTAEYEKAASEALGVPVKIASARLAVLTGVEVKLEGVSVGDAVKIRLVRGSPEMGSLFGAKKAFSRIELEGALLSQDQLGAAAFGKVAGENFRVARIVMKQAKFDGPLTLPALDIEAKVASDGTLQSIALDGPDKLAVRLTPKGSELEFEISAASLALPFVPALSLSDFGMKGTASRQGVSASEFDGRAFDGLISGKARIGWGANWSAEGELRARGVKVAVFAPTLVSEGKVEALGKFSMSGPVPAKLYEAARLDGTFKIDNGVIGNFDLTRALQTGGTQTGGRTVFAELTGQGVYDKGNVQLRNIAITAGAMSAGVSLDIDAGGALLGRIAADVKTPNQTLRAVLNISGKLQDPVVRK